MTIDQVRTLHRSELFQPFCIRLADGRTINVKRAESLAINARRRSFAVAYQGVFEIIDLSLVTSAGLVNGPRTGNGES